MRKFSFTGTTTRRHFQWSRLTRKMLGPGKEYILSMRLMAQNPSSFYSATMFRQWMVQRQATECTSTCYAKNHKARTTSERAAPRLMWLTSITRPIALPCFLRTVKRTLSSNMQWWEKKERNSTFSKASTSTNSLQNTTHLISLSMQAIKNAS